jgi:hypothetical protein
LIIKSPGLYLPWLPKDNGLKKKYSEESFLEWYKVGSTGISGQDDFTVIRSIIEK